MEYISIYIRTWYFHNIELWITYTRKQLFHVVALMHSVWISSQWMWLCVCVHWVVFFSIWNAIRKSLKLLCKKRMMMTTKGSGFCISKHIDPKLRDSALENILRYFPFFYFWFFYFFSLNFISVFSCFFSLSLFALVAIIVFVPVCLHVFIILLIKAYIFWMYIVYNAVVETKQITI